MSFNYPSPSPHNKHSNVQIPFLSLPVQVTGARHAIKTDCGVGVAAVGNTCYYILVMVGDPTNKCGNTVF